MASKIRFVLASASLAVLLAAPGAGRADESVHCSVMKNGKSETIEVASAAECKKLGGQVVAQDDEILKRK